MIQTKIAKVLLAASAVAGLAFIAAPSPSEAASAAYCEGYARNVADDYAPRRGLIGSALALPFDVTGAVLTGRTTYDARWERAYNRAYANCRASGRVAVVVPEERGLIAEPPVASTNEEEEGSPCDFSSFHSSWDPTRC